MPSSPFSPATLLVTAAAQLCAGGAAMAAEAPGDGIAALLIKGQPLRTTLTALPVTPPASGGAPTAAAIAPAAQRFPAPDPQTLLLLLVQLDDLTLTDGMSAYGLPDDPLLPVGELSRLLELDVDVSPGDGRVTGRIGEARRALLIDLAANIARIGPTQAALAPGDVAVEPAEIYLRASVLARLLPLKFDIDPRAQQMRITATELLPIQGRLQRLARIRQTAPKPATEVMRVEEPYKLFTPPSFDVALGLGAQTTDPKAPTRYDIRLGGDLLYAGLQAYFGSDDSGRLTTGRVLLEKRSLDGDLLGPIHARVVDVGDVFTPGLSIGPRSLGGRGVMVSNVPLDQTSVFNRVDLRGELPIGDDVELYVNDVLQGTQNTAVNGQYEFLAVPLTQGINVIRIVTYGPHGERSEETRVINASGGLLRPGQATFEFGAVEQNVSLLRIGDTDPFVVDHITGKSRVVADFNYGLTQSLTLSAGTALYTDQLGVERQLYTGGLRTSLAGFASEVDLAADNRGGEGVSVDVAGRLFGTNTVLRQSFYRGGLLDENNAEADLDRPLSARTELTVDDNIVLGGKPIPITVRALRDAYADGGVAWIAQVRGSESLGSILYSSGFEYDHTIAPGGGEVTDVLRGFFGVSTFRNYRWQVRATLDYDAIPDIRVSGLEIVADRALSDTWSLRLGATAQLDAPKAFEVLAGTTTKTRYGDLALTGQYDTTNNSWQFAAQMNFGLGFDPKTGYRLTRSGPGSGGSVLFHAFIDDNGNGKFDPGERPVPNVVLEGGERKARTDADGRAFITGFGAGPTARLLVNISAVEDQAIKTPPTVIEFSPRPGGVTEIEYPVRPTGEVMVNVRLRRPGQPSVGLSATRVRLVDARGLAVEGVTEFDGSVNFHDLPAGTYRLELDPEQAQRLRMRLLAPVTVTIAPDGSITPDASAEVEFQPRGDTAAPPGSL